MKIRTIRIKTLDEGFNDFTSAFRKASKSRKGGAKEEIFFASVQAARRILTPQRISMLRYIKKHKPGSVYELAKGLGKDLKNISQDLQYLRELGVLDLSDLATSRRRKKPVLLFDRIRLELAV